MVRLLLTVETLKRLYIKQGACIMLLVFLHACTKEIQYPSIEYDKTVIINAFITNDSFRAAVTEPVNSLENKSKKGIKANIRLSSKNGEKTYKTTDGIITEKITYTNDSVHLVFKNIDQTQKFNASTYVPTTIKIQSLRRIDTNIIINEGLENITCRLTFNDPIEEANYYEFTAISTFYNDQNEIKSSFQRVNIANGTLINTNTKISQSTKGILFSDSLFNGTMVSIDFNGFIFIRNSNDGYVLVNDTFQITGIIRNVSKEYYNYKKSVARIRLNNSSDLFSGPAVPVQLYSNIENGLGIFAGYSSSHKTITIIYNE